MLSTVEERVEEHQPTKLAVFSLSSLHHTLCVTIRLSIHEGHGPRLNVCQAPNAFTCVSNVAPPKHQMRSKVCHQMRLLNPQHNGARFACTFFHNLNWNSGLKNILVWRLILVLFVDSYQTQWTQNGPKMDPKMDPIWTPHGDTLTNAFGP